MTTPTPPSAPDANAQRLAAMHEPVALSAAELQHAQFPTPRAVLPGLLYGGLCLLCGAPKGRKSWLALDLAISVATGTEFWGRQCPQGRVLYLDIEWGSSPRRTQKRLGELLAERRMDDWPELLMMRWPPIPRVDEGFEALLLRYLQQYPDLRFIIIDPFQMIRPAGRDEGTYAGDYRMGALAAFAVEHRITLLALHHLRKMPGDHPLEEVSGTTGLTGAVDGIWVHKPNSTKTAAELWITGRDVEEDPVLKLARDSGTARWMEDPSAQWSGRQERHIIIRVMEAHGFSMTTQEVLDRANRTEHSFSYEALRKLLSRMERDGELTKERQGKDNVWAIQPRNAETVQIDMGTPQTTEQHAVHDVFGE